MAIFLWDILISQVHQCHYDEMPCYPHPFHQQTFRSLTVSSTPPDGLWDGTGFMREFVGSRDAATSLTFPRLRPPQGHENPPLNFISCLS
ncbi:hypothetical protein P692DRAFT_20838037 [Suillus brevipes Sb2]|nr:hypothetical protein P692DRAFT_20838037 [Suillus brevipes Sb2]